MPLNQQAESFLVALALKSPPGWEQLSPREGREAFDGLSELFGQGPELDLVEDRTLPGNIRVRVFHPSPGQRRPVVMYFHGGGWVLGSTQTHDPICRRIAKSSGCAVISVDYGLAPENRFPGPLDDCYGATLHVARHADQFDVDADRLAVVGDSAGGNLAAAVTLRARDEAGPAIKRQVLIYPVIEPQFETESYTRFAEDYALTRAAMQWFWKQYIGDGPVPPLAAPSRAASHEGLPPAHVITAEYDVLRDEGEAYARLLSDAGVPTTLRRYDGNLHGFVQFAAAFDDGLQAAEDIAQILKAV